jgi:predicted nucleic acid-binding protein
MGAIQEEAESLLAGAEYEVDSRSVMLLVKDSDCSACDCEFVALARQLGASLVTMDGKLLRMFPEIARALVAAR